MDNFHNPHELSVLWFPRVLVMQRKKKSIFLTTSLGPGRELLCLGKVCSKTLGIGNKNLRTAAEAKKKRGVGDREAYFSCTRK